MFSSRQHRTFGSWHVGGHPQIIEYSHQVLGAIAVAALEGYRKFPHGGIEIGGVLFGEGDRHLVRILAARPIPCEHHAGPSFTLSETDQEALAGVLEDARRDPELRDLAPVGLYISHTRSKVNLRPADAELHERYFPEPWQLALIFRPLDGESVGAGVFVKTSSGMLPTEPTHFVDEVPLGTVATPPPAPAKDEPPREPAGAAPLPVTDRSLPAPFASYLRNEKGIENRARRRWFGFVLGAVLLLAGLGVVSRWLTPPEYWQAVGHYREAAARYAGTVLAYWRSPASPPAPPAVGLRTLASGNNVIVRWDPMSAVLRKASAGVLEITDGAGTTRRKLDAAGLFQGSAIYRRHTGDVRVQLRVERRGAAPIVAATRFLGNAPAPAATDSPEQVDQLQAQLQARQAANTALEQTLRSLEAPPRKQPDKLTTVPKVALIQHAPTLAQKAPSAAQRPALIQQKPVAPPVETPVQSPAAAAKPAPYQGPAQGKLIWAGLLAAGHTLVVDGGQPSQGMLSGALPGVPVEITVQPAELTGGGLVVNSGGAAAIEVVEAPNPSNNWSRFSFRATGKALSAVAVEWKLAPSVRR